MEIPDSAVPEEDDPLLVPVLLSPSRTQSSENSYDATGVSSGGDPDEGIPAGSAPAVDDGAGDSSGWSSCLFVCLRAGGAR